MAAPQGTPTLSFTQLWSIEAIRLRETEWGPLADEAELRRARAAHLPLAQALALRAELLSQRLGWAEQQQRFWRYLRAVLVGLAVVALLVGVGAAQAALGQANQPVNLVRAIVILLGLPTVGLLLWVLTLVAAWGRLPSLAILPYGWRWLASKLARGPDSALLLRALFNVIAQQRLRFWWLSVMHHGFWLLALTAALCTLGALLAFKRYFFQWETTLLAPEQFIHLAQWASAGLQFIGVAVPSPEIVRHSDGLSVLGAQGHALWASWLLGCVGLYGLLPRLLAGGVSGLGLRYRQQRYALDLQRPGLWEQQARFAVQAQGLGVDRPATLDKVPLRVKTQMGVLNASEPTWVIGMELDPQWQLNAKLPQHWQWYGVVDSRAERQHLLQQLQAQRIKQLILICDGQQTPDRGLMAWLVEVAGYTQQTLVLIDGGAAEVAETLRPAWKQRLAAAGLPMIFGDWSTLMAHLDK